MRVVLVAGQQLIVGAGLVAGQQLEAELVALEHRADALIGAPVERRDAELAAGPRTWSGVA